MLNLKMIAIGAVLAIAVSILANMSSPGLARADGPYLDDTDRSQVTFTLSEPDGELLVAFENGDIRAPYLLGSLWNGNDEPPESDSSDSEEDKD